MKERAGRRTTSASTALRPSRCTIRSGGDLTLAFEMLELPAEPGLSVLTYSAEPGSPSEGAPRDLARWSETRTKLSAVRVGSEI